MSSGIQLGLENKVLVLKKVINVIYSNKNNS